MAFSIGLDVGGTKIAGAAFAQNGEEVVRVVQPTPKDYQEFIGAIQSIIKKLEESVEPISAVGIGIPGAIGAKADPLPSIANIPCLSGQNLRSDLEARLGHRVRLANDADCAALSEAVDGAGRGYQTVFGLIMGTGVGGGFVVDGRLVQGANGLTGEFGHLPLPFREESDGPLVNCACGQVGCIDKSASGPALLRLHEQRTGKTLTASPQIAELARQGDAEALATLDSFYTTVAKAMLPVLHMFDPEIIVACGGLSSLPGLIEAVPNRWARYTMIRNIRTSFVQAKHGAMSGLRGAAWLSKST